MVEERWPLPHRAQTLCSAAGVEGGVGAGWDWSHESLPGMCVGEQKLKRHSVNKMILKFARRRKREKYPRKVWKREKENMEEERSSVQSFRSSYLPSSSLGSRRWRLR